MSAVFGISSRVVLEQLPQTRTHAQVKAIRDAFRRGVFLEEFRKSASPGLITDLLEKLFPKVE